MDVSVTVTVPDYVFSFYQKIAEQMPPHTVQEVMSDALFCYAGTVAEEMNSGKR